MADNDWVNGLLPYQAQETLDRLAKMDIPLSPNEATEFLRLERALRAKAGSTYEPGP